MARACAERPEAITSIQSVSRLSGGITGMSIVI